MNAISVIGRLVSVSNRLADNNLVVSASCSGETPNSDCTTRLKCRSLMPISSASSLTDDLDKAPSSMCCAIMPASRPTASTLALPGASSGRQRRHGL